MTMIPQHRAKIYPARQRRRTQKGDDFRSYHTFNFGACYDKNKEAPGKLLFLNEDTLNIGVRAKTLIQQGTSLLLLPLAGGVAYASETSGETTGFVEAGHACWLSAAQEMEVELSNPYAHELVSFLQIGFRLQQQSILCSTTEFDLEAHPDCLLPLFFSGEDKQKYTLGNIGKFGGRASGSYTVGNPATGVFVFVIDGVFEVQDRLLQSCDGLALWEMTEVEFEALSHEAILLFLEMEPNLEVL